MTAASTAPRCIECGELVVARDLDDQARAMYRLVRAEGPDLEFCRPNCRRIFMDRERRRKKKP